MYLWLGLKPKHIVAAFTGVNVYDDARGIQGNKTERPTSAPILDQDTATTEEGDKDAPDISRR